MDDRDIDIMNVFFDYYDGLKDSHLVVSHTGDYSTEDTINAVLAAVLTIFKVKEKDNESI